MFGSTGAGLHEDCVQRSFVHQNVTPPSDQRHGTRANGSGTVKASPFWNLKKCRNTAKQEGFWRAPTKETCIDGVSRC
jgi:hypothetical protein